MNKLIDKLIIFFFCAAIYVQNESSIYVVVPVILAIIFSCINDLVSKNSYKILVLSLYILFCMFYIDFIYFIPLICYDIFSKQFKWYFLIPFIPVILNFSKLTFTFQVIIVSFIGVTWLMKYRTTSLEDLKKEYSSLRDTSTEFSMALKNKNKELLEKQDYEINIATLKERNRIAREIHDTVGHLLSSSILQIGALISTSKDEIIKDNLEIIKSTLSQGMDSIRCSIHDMHDEYVDLENEIKSIVNNFNFCNISFNYDIQNNPNKKIKFCFISIIKEALSNIIKHSDATQVNITLREHPALYQLVISDNGNKKNAENTDGIGIKNMIDRVNSLNGIININNQNGYFIFISIPKEKIDENI